MKESFTAKAYKVGNSVVLTVPAFLVKDGRILVGKHYEITVEAQKNGGLQQTTN